MEVQLRLGFVLLVLVAHFVPAAAVPSSQCPKQCGDVEIPYPFGIGVNCSLSWSYSVQCLVQDGISKPFMGDFEVLNISLTHSTVRVLNYIASFCYNTSSRRMEKVHYTFNATNSPYMFSDVHNKFIVIGCNALAYISDSSDTGYGSGCVSKCGGLSDLIEGSCSGIGCCETAIPRGLNFYVADFDARFNTSNIWKFNRCNYAVLMETTTFNFSSTYISTTNFNNTNDGRVPMVIDWAIRESSCEIAKQNATTYACRSSNSDCLNSINGPGYVCNCSKGYQGNPYLVDGCKDINECSQNPCPLGGICHNMEGDYWCSCQPGKKYYRQTNTCNSDIGLIIGITIGIFSLVTFSLSGYIIFENRKLKHIKQEHFRQHGGLILFERMKLEKGLAFTIFTEDELIQATNNYNKSKIIGKGGHGTVYKGIVKGNMHVAIKRCALIDERQKKEFGQEMLILSQVNHKNIVKLVGACLEVEVPMLVYEFIPNGTLYELIHGKKQTWRASFNTLLRIAHEAAEGLSFLHSYASPPILHGDVKTANILLDENYTAKVSDFGASILVPSDEDQYVTMVQGTCGYLDPEYMQTFQLTDKSDVYSFGVILLEVLTGQIPLKFDGPEKVRSLSINFLSAMKENNLDALLPNHVKDRENTELIKGLAELAKQCLDMCGSNRPTMKEISDELSRLRRLPLHPWAQTDAELQSKSKGLLVRTSPAGFDDIEISSSAYRMQE